MVRVRDGVGGVSRRGSCPGVLSGGGLSVMLPFCTVVGSLQETFTNRARAVISCSTV